MGTAGGGVVGSGSTEVPGKEADLNGVWKYESVPSLDLLKMVDPGSVVLSLRPSVDLSNRDSGSLQSEGDIAR